MIASREPMLKRARPAEVQHREDVTVRFCGDSGDGMQLAGTQMTATSAVFGNDISTLPDFPAEIRAPAGSLAGVSGFQLNFGSHDLLTPGDRVNALVAMNPAALKTNLVDLEPGGILIVNEDAFNENNLIKAGYKENPLHGPDVKNYQLFCVPMDKLTLDACKPSGLTGRDASRCRNFTALGLVYWLFGRPMDATLKWIEDKFGKKRSVADANIACLKAGYFFGETAEMFPVRYVIPAAKIAAGKYRRISGNEAIAMGLVAAAVRAGKPLFYGSYPITPASDILHELSMYKQFDVRTFQAEDEIAAITSTIGASYAGAFAVTGTSGPGMALKTEGIGLAVMTELPLVIVDVQRGGPSTGLPTKTEQADYNQATVGRNGEAPVCVIAPSTPGDCFDMAIEAFRIAVEFMTPVIILSDGYLANGAEPWRIPDVESLPTFEIRHPKPGEEYQPYMRNKDLARPWALPGTPGLQHRIGGLEKQDISGDVCYEPENHEHMCKTRRQKIQNIARTLPPVKVLGDEQGGELLVVGWGSTFGAITSAVQRCRAKGMSVSSVHLRYLEPMQPNVGDVLKRFRRVLVPEMNLGQLVRRLRGEFLTDAVPLNKIQGKPFMISEIAEKIESMLLNGRMS